MCPGYTETELLQTAIDRIISKTGRDASAARQLILRDAGQLRMVTVKEVADCVLTLCSTSSGSLTGQALVLDGSSPT